MARTSPLSLIIVAGGVVAGLLGAAALERAAVYEDWTHNSIRPDRWVGGQALGAQEVRPLVTPDHRLLLRHRRVGSTTSNTGNTSTHQLMRPLSHTLINEIEAVFTVTHLSMTTCTANNSGGVTQARPARLHMEKFNDGSTSGVGDRTGDYLAVVQAFRNESSVNPPGVLNVQGSVVRCTDPGCTTATSIVIHTLTTTVSIGQTFTLRLKWDPSGRQYLFGLDGSGDIALSYAISDTAPPALGQVEVGVQHVAANCLVRAVVIDSTTEVGMVSTNSSAVIR